MTLRTADSRTEGSPVQYAGAARIDVAEWDYTVKQTDVPWLMLLVAVMFIGGWVIQRIYGQET